MDIPAACVVSICLLLSLSLVSASSVMVIVFEQSDRTVLIPEAIIYADGEIAGKTDLNGAFNLQFEGFRPNIRVAKGGYTDWMGAPSENDTAILVPLQVRNSTLHVEVFDADSLIPIRDARIAATSEDGILHEGFSGYDGKVDLPLRADQVYNLEINAQDFQQERDIIVTGGNASTVQYPLVRNDRISIKVTDSVTGSPVPLAKIQIDGALAGISNDRGVVISNTSRNVEHFFDISAEGYDPVHLSRAISFEDQVVDFPLTKAKSTLFISVYNKDQKPLSGAQVSMDGTIRGDTNEFGRLMLSSLEMKPYEFTVTRDGYKKNTQIYAPVNETGDLIIVLESELIDLSVLVSDNRDVPLSNVTLFLIGDNQETLSTNETGLDGISILPAIEGRTYRVKAEKGGYYPNSTSVSTQSNPNRVILHNPATINQSSPGSGIPWVFGVIALVVLVAGAGAYLVITRKGHSRRRSRGGRRRSL